MATTTRRIMLYISLLQIFALCGIQALNETLDEDPTSNEEIENEYYGKHEDFANCPKFVLDPDEYVIYSNATAYVKDYNKSYTEEFYLLEGESLVVCVPIPEDELKDHDPTHTLDVSVLHHLTAVGIATSMVCLLIHLVVFVVVPEKRNLPDYNMVSLCASLFLSYLMMVVTLVEKVHQNREACVAAAGIMQFFLMASFQWMFVIAFDVFKSIRKATKNLRAAPAGFKVKTFLCNNLMAWGVALIFTAAAMIVDNIKGVPEEFQPQFDVMCWFNQKTSLMVFFFGPVFTVICINFILFGFSSYKIFTNRMKPNSESQQTKLRKNHVMYFRLAIIMGVTWITGALAPLVNALWLWFVFTILNAFVGLFIFVAFTCTAHVRKYFRNKIFGERVPKMSLAPTFQTYISTDESIEKDMNKEGLDPNSKSGIIDAAVTHL